MAIICTFRTLKQGHFLAESLLECMDCHLNVYQSIGTTTAEKSQRQTGNNIFLEIRVNKINITCCSSSESNNKTIRLGWIVRSIYGCSQMRRQYSSWTVTHDGLDCNKCIFNKRLKEVLTIKPFHNANVQNFRQTNCKFSSESMKKRNETADFGVILHVCTRKDIKGSRLI